MARISLLVAVLTAASGRTVALSVEKTIEERALAISKIEMSKVQMEVDIAVQALRENMTLEKALSSVSKRTNATPALMLMLKGAVQSQRHVRKRNRASDFLGMVQTDPDMPEYASGVEKAKNMINEMLTEVVHKIDSTHLECKKGFDDKCEIMEFLRADMNELNAENAESNGDAIKYQGQIAFLEEEEPRLREVLENNRVTCSRKLHNLNQLKGTVESDIKVIEGVLNMTDCSQAALIQSSHTALLKCFNCRNSTPFYRFQSAALHEKVSSIKSKGIQEKVLAALESMANSGAKQHKKSNPMVIPDPVEVEVPANPCEDASYDKRPLGEQGGCSIATNPNCNNLQGKFLDIQIEMIEVHEHIKKQMEKTANDCSTVEMQTNAELAHAGVMRLQSEKELAHATRSMQRSGEDVKRKHSEHEKYNTELQNMRDQCTNNLRDYEAEKCQLEKIRSEIFLKTSTEIDKAMFIDCEVDEWVTSECLDNKGQPWECGGKGGTQTLTRNVVQEAAFGGVECPPLSVEQECNTHDCPVDCYQGEWTEWSTCTAACDGGVLLHTREIFTHPTRGGTPCGPVTETEVCNSQSCDPDCTLYDWTKWSECSKICGSGHKHRIRIESKPAQGQGTCPEVFGPERLQELTCNEDPCPAVANISCTSKLDIVFLVDGSGSLGENAYNAEMEFVSNLTYAFQGHDTQISVVLFSGPWFWHDYWLCTFAHKYISRDMMKQVCGIETLSHLGTDMEAIRASLADVPYPAGTTFTSGALRMAASELKFARPEAERIVVTMTDGKPIDNDWTEYTAATLMSEGIHLVVAPIEGLGSNPLTGAEPVLKKLASPNIEDNTLDIKDWKQMFQYTTQATLVEDVCGLGVKFPIMESRSSIRMEFEEGK